MLPKLVSALSPALATDRRRFMIGAAALAGGLAIGFRSTADAAEAAAPATAGPAVSPFQAYVIITPDERIEVISSQFDMGQGSYHGVATLVLDELGGRMDQLDVIGGWGNPKLYGNLTAGGAFQFSGGSTSMASSWDRYRIAGATARQMLVNAAAAEWGVNPAEITTWGGRLRHGEDRSATFGQMVAKAAALPVPADVKLKDPSAWTLIGNENLRRYDSPAKANGTHGFTIDVTAPGMLTAVMIHPPKFGATVKSVDGAAALQVKGVRHVVQIQRGVAVVADNMWAALKGRDAVTVVWDDTNAEKRSSAQIMAEYRATAAKPPAAMAVKVGDSGKAMKAAAKVVTATYEFPYLAHASMEPLNAAARMNADGTVEVWGGHQMPDIYQMLIAKAAGTTPDKVKLHVMKTGGGFGRRAVADGDVIVEATAISKAIGGAPVKLQWTRENDMRAGRYRPAYVHALKAGLDKYGNIVAWEHHIVGQSIMTGTPFEAGIQNGIDPTSVEGASNLPYVIPSRTIGLTTMKAGVPVLWWRSVGSTHTGYAVETFMDECAKAAGKDPLAFRLSHLQMNPRHAAVLKLAADAAGWATPPAAGRHRGLSVVESFSTYVAQVAEVSVTDGGVKVHKVTCAVDCGIAVNPDTVRAQMEGGIGFGLGAILGEEITLGEGGAVDQANFDAYMPLRIESMPDVEVHILPSTKPPTGVGEPGVPPIGPAVANAIFAASGKMVHTLPIAKGMSA